MIGVDTIKHRLQPENVRIPRRGEWKYRADDWSLLLLGRGNGTLQDGNCCHGFRAGELALLPAGIEVLVKADPVSEALISCLVIPANAMAGRLSLGARLVFRRAASGLRGATILSASSPLSLKVKELLPASPPSGNGKLNPSDEWNGLTRFCEELSEFLADFLGSASSTPSRIFAVLRSIDESVLQKLSVIDLARRCGCSRRHLNRLIRELCDCSLASIRFDLRLDKAARTLRSTNHKIIDVAMDCGFNHLGSFTARFRRRFGATPGEWRKKFVETRNPGEPAKSPTKTLHAAHGRRFQPS